MWPVGQGQITPINNQIKCALPQHFEGYTILLAASSAGRDWWYVVVIPRRVEMIRIRSRGRPPCPMTTAVAATGASAMAPIRGQRASEFTVLQKPLG